MSGVALTTVPDATATVGLAATFAPAARSIEHTAHLQRIIIGGNRYDLQRLVSADRGIVSFVVHEHSGHHVFFASYWVLPQYGPQLFVLSRFILLCVIHGFDQSIDINRLTAASAPTTTAAA